MPYKKSPSWAELIQSAGPMWYNDCAGIATTGGQGAEGATRDDPVREVGRATLDSLSRGSTIRGLVEERDGLRQERDALREVGEALAEQFQDALDRYLPEGGPTERRWRDVLARWTALVEAAGNEPAPERTGRFTRRPRAKNPGQHLRAG